MFGSSLAILWNIYISVLLRSYMHKNLASFNNKYLLKDYCTASFVHVIIKVENLGGLRLIWSFQIEPIMTGIQRGSGNPHDCDRGFFFHVQLTVWRHRQELPSKVRPRQEEGPGSVKSQRQDICQPWEFRHSASEEEISPLIKVSKKKNWGWGEFSRCLRSVPESRK